jgi:ribosomal protein L32
MFATGKRVSEQRRSNTAHTANRQNRSFAYGIRSELKGRLRQMDNDKKFHPNWKSLSDCPDCGEFRTHDHDCRVEGEAAPAPQAATLDESKIDTTGFTDAQCRQVLAAIQLSRELGFRDGRSSVGQAEAPRPSAPNTCLFCSQVLSVGPAQLWCMNPLCSAQFQPIRRVAESLPSAEEVCPSCGQIHFCGKLSKPLKL